MKTKYYSTNRKKFINTLFFVMFMGGMIMWTVPVFAGFNMSAMPISGGTTIRFGRVDLTTTVNKEVRIRVNSSEEKQYQVFQRVSRPFRNERGETLEFDAIMVASQSGSNGTGTLEAQNAERLSYADQLVYTSSNNGLSDSFILIYQINPTAISTGGNYSGQISYTLRPIGGGSQEEVSLSAFLEISADFSVSNEASSGRDRVRLSSEGQAFKEGYFKISFDGNRGGELKIYQEVIQFPVNEINKDIDEDTVILTVSGGENGEINLSDQSVLSRRRELIYSSSALSDDLQVNFVLNESKEGVQLAGDFRGRLNYVLESPSLNQTIPVDLEVEIAPQFQMVTDYPVDGMSFQQILPDGEPQYKEVLVTVNSNLGKPYAVSQILKTALTNERSQQIEDKYFTCMQELMEDQTGKIEQSEFSPLTEGESNLYFSDNFGSPARFKVIYRLRPYSGIQAGDYKTSVMYTLGEI